jgi:hypothetical protein
MLKQPLRGFFHVDLQAYLKSKTSFAESPSAVLLQRGSFMAWVRKWFMPSSMQQAQSYGQVMPVMLSLDPK